MDATRLSAALGDRYQIEREIGRGGMATVWLARDVRHDRHVALKVLRPDLSAVLGGERFLREVRITARLDHPHILTLIDSGETDGHLWYVLPYIRGESLRQRLDSERQLAVPEAVAIARQVAGALDYAHRQGIVHRDIKPENILLHEGEAVLADFGIALAVREAGGSRLTETGLSLGTPQYMSPEQATGDRQVDGRSDLYSLGAVLYEMLAGDPPHAGTSVQAVIAKLLTERPTPVGRMRDTVSPALEAAVMRALAKVPADRFASAGDFARALDASSTSAETSSRSATQPSSRRWLIPALVGGLALVAAAVALGGRQRAEGPGGLLDPPRERLTNSGDIRLPTISPDGGRALFARRRCTAECVMDIVTRDIAGGAELTLLRGMRGAYGLQWSPDGRAVAVNGTDGQGRFGMFTISALGGEPAWHRHPFGTFLGSADTLLLIRPQTADAPERMLVVTRRDGVVRDSVMLRGPHRETGGYQPSPDGRALLVIALTDDSADARPRLLLARRDGTILDSTLIGLRNLVASPPSWVADGSAVLVAAPDTSASNSFFLHRIPIDLRRGAIGTISPPLMRLGTTFAPYVSLTADGTTLAYGAGSIASELHVWTGTDARPPYTWRTRLTRTEPFVADLAPSGRWIALSQGGPGGSELELLPFDSGPVRPLTSRLPALLQVEWSSGPSGERLYYATPADGAAALRAIDPASGGEVSLPPLPGVVFMEDLEPMPDGGVAWVEPRRVRARGADGVVRELHFPNLETFSVHAAPTGSLLMVSGWRIPAFDTLDILVHDLADGTSRVVFSDLVESLQAGFLADGTIRAAVHRTIGSVELMELFPDGRPPRSLGPLPYSEASYRWAVDGTRGIAVEPVSRDDLWLVRNAQALIGGPE